MKTDLSTLTAAELAALPEDEFRYDLLEGELLRMSPASGPHGRIGYLFLRRLGDFVEQHDLGDLFLAETGFQISSNPDTVLAPDVAFVKRERARSIKNVEGFVPLAPDLVVEVQSPSDRATHVQAKVAAWLNAGTRVVILINPKSQTLQVCRSMASVLTLTAVDVLDLSDLEAGWLVKLTGIF